MELSGSPLCPHSWGRRADLLLSLQLSLAKEVGSEIKPHIPLIVYTILAIFTRLYRIGAADSVVWDEVRSSLSSI